ncbi:uncharacterized protein KY384_007415 [Bacidia gigantensis]|uniref:uncharacterized protein n=1 Tax=Bacidia gigantensis TaxID=2732470 RepID=UPI001D044805|nr:uncharacterized protein KY384_007415 [Bacidia gigantensis]KAG8528497.1 hypothetical protein KY384_007415 [Bacidia gigantensis]
MPPVAKAPAIECATFEVTFGAEPNQNLDEATDKAKQFPLAKSAANLKMLRLRVDYAKVKSMSSKEHLKILPIMDRIRHLTTGKISADIDSPIGNMIRGDNTALLQESRIQREQLGLLQGCRIKVNRLASRRVMIIEVWTGKVASSDAEKVPNEVKEFDFGDKKQGISYRIKGAHMFRDETEEDKEALQKEYKIKDSFGPTFGWQFNVIKSPVWSNAPLCGILRNSVPSEEFDFFCGEARGVSLEPIENDGNFVKNGSIVILLLTVIVLGERSRLALKMGMKEFDAWSQLCGGYIKSIAKSSKLPIIDLFGGGHPVPEKNKGPKITIPKDVTRHCTPTQIKGIDQALDCRVSSIWGPPGTGKSSVLAFIVCWLASLGEPGSDNIEKVLATALTNAAVDALMGSCVERWKKMFPNKPAPFVRVFSESQIRAQLKNKDREALEDAFHLDNVRLRYARSHPGFDGFIEGRKALWEDGDFDSEGQVKGYNESITSLNEALLWEGDEVRVVFCTIASCTSQSLFEVSKIDGKLQETATRKPFFKPRTVIIDEIGVVNRPQMMIPVMAFQTTERLILAGDPKQLGGVYFSEAAKLAWQAGGCYFNDILARSWPCTCDQTVLDRQFRMHDDLYAHLVAVIYKQYVLHRLDFCERETKRLPREISSRYMTNNPSSFLQHLQKNVLPLHLEANGDVFNISSYLNFIDVDGVQQPEGTSSFNQAEVEGVCNLAATLIGQGASKNDIAILTGYAAQRKKIQRRLKEMGLDGIAMPGMTIDASQGKEWKIVIDSLVTSKGQTGFIGHSPRANVGTSRQAEMLYFVGSASFWIAGGRKEGPQFMHDILRHMNENAGPRNREPFVVRAEGLPCPPPTRLALPAAPASSSAAPTATTGSNKGKQIEAENVEDSPAVKLDEQLRIADEDREELLTEFNEKVENELRIFDEDIASRMQAREQGLMQFEKRRAQLGEEKVEYEKKMAAEEEEWKADRQHMVDLFEEAKKDLLKA